MQLTEHADNLIIDLYFRGLSGMQILNGISCRIRNVCVAESAQKEFDAAFHIVKVKRR